MGRERRMTQPPEDENFDGNSKYVMRLPPNLHRLHEARQFVCDAIAEWGVAPTEEAALLTSEVVSNAMVHGEGPVAVHVRRVGNRALVEVHDDSSEPPKPQSPDARRPGGNGMIIVEALASSWGVTNIHEDGKIVWFEVPLPT